MNQIATEVLQPVQLDQFLRLPEVERLVGLKRSTLYQMAREGRFVKPVRVSPRCTAWPASKVHAWMQERVAAAQEAERAPAPA